MRDEENKKMLEDAKKIKSGEWEEAIDERTGNELYLLLILLDIHLCLVRYEKLSQVWSLYTYDVIGATALHVAAAKGYVDVVKYGIKMILYIIFILRDYDQKITYVGFY